MIPVMNAALVLAVAVVMPLCLGGRWWAWLLAAASVALALLLPPGLAAGALLALWVVLAAERALQHLAARAWLSFIAAGFGVVAALALLASRLELTLFGILEPIVKLTALHFSYAGVGTLSLSRWLYQARPASRLRRLAVGLVVVAPVTVALGFITRSAVGQVGGAVLMTAGAWLVAALHLLEARSLRGSARVLLTLSGLSPWVSMVLALAWAANNYWPTVPTLTVVDLVPTHGALNAFGFVLCALVSRAIDGRSGTPASSAARAAPAPTR